LCFLMVAPDTRRAVVTLHLNGVQLSLQCPHLCTANYSC
jgi:hypothetical protein